MLSVLSVNAIMALQPASAQQTVKIGA